MNLAETYLRSRSVIDSYIVFSLWFFIDQTDCSVQSAA